MTGESTLITFTYIHFITGCIICFHSVSIKSATLPNKSIALFNVGCIFDFQTFLNFLESLSKTGAAYLLYASRMAPSISLNPSVISSMSGFTCSSYTLLSFSNVSFMLSLSVSRIVFIGASVLLIASFKESLLSMIGCVIILKISFPILDASDSIPSCAFATIPIRFAVALLAFSPRKTVKTSASATARSPACVIIPDKLSVIVMSEFLINGRFFFKYLSILPVKRSVIVKPMLATDPVIFPSVSATLFMKLLSDFITAGSVKSVFNDCLIPAMLFLIFSTLGFQSPNPNLNPCKKRFFNSMNFFFTPSKSSDNFCVNFDVSFV